MTGLREHSLLQLYPQLAWHPLRLGSPTLPRCSLEAQTAREETACEGVALRGAVFRFIIKSTSELGLEVSKGQSMELAPSASARHP